MPPPAARRGVGRPFRPGSRSGRSQGDATGWSDYPGLTRPGGCSVSAGAGGLGFWATWVSLVQRRSRRPRRAGAPAEAAGRETRPVTGGGRQRWRWSARPTARCSTPVPGVVKLPAALSPSRAGDFQQCPLLYRLRVVDKVPGAAERRGHQGHAGARGARAAVRPARPAGAPRPRRWTCCGRSGRSCSGQRPELGGLFATEDGSARPGWPRRRRCSAPSTSRWRTRTGSSRPSASCSCGRRWAEGGDRLLLRGFVDRLDIAPNGAAAGGGLQDRQGAPAGEYEEKTLFQMKFYALVLWKGARRGAQAAAAAVPGRTERGAHLRARARRICWRRSAEIAGIWASIRQGRPRASRWKPKPSKLCGWCDHKALCPEYGGTPPVLPPVQVVEASDAVPGQRGRAATTTSEAGGEEG